MTWIRHLRLWAKQGQSPYARWIWRTAKQLRSCSFPVFPPLHRMLYTLHYIIKNMLSGLLRILYWTPLFQSRLTAPASQLYLYSGMPQVIGPLHISIGKKCQISGVSSFIGRQTTSAAHLEIGDRCHIGWQTTFAVGRKIKIGNDVFMAGKVFLAGFPGHPLNPEERAAGLAEHEDQVGDIVLEDKVWLGTGVMVNAGVHIGYGTVVAAGSIVTHNLPERVLAAGIPAKVIKALPSESLLSLAAGSQPFVREPSHE
ncbi:MAG: acyltransferase [Plesiomonas sp.]|uniref:acyltransferase n=1 Tax=Plesiomonas sp. TaxID=2486279 RepID=UPI003F3A6492